MSAYDDGDWHTGSWCRRCGRAWFACDRGDAECQRHALVFRLSKAEAALKACIEYLHTSCPEGDVAIKQATKVLEMLE